MEERGEALGLGLVDAMRCNSGETVSLMYFDGTTLGTLAVLTRSTVMYCSDTTRRRARRLNVWYSTNI